MDREKIIHDLMLSNGTLNPMKDIIMIVHNQKDYVKTAIESIIKFTDNFHLYIWDNASNKELSSYLYSKQFELQDQFCIGLPCSSCKASKKITVTRSETNFGFVIPNNNLISVGNSPYVILLNSDVEVLDGWDLKLVNFLENNPDYAQVGYLGGILDENGQGTGAEYGEDVDYICGWAFAIKRETYQQYGLFDPNFEFAYCEDADFSLRLKQAGKKIYALNLDLVRHFGNKTIKYLKNTGNTEIYRTFEKNHNYMRSKWKIFLEKSKMERK